MNRNHSQGSIGGGRGERLPHQEWADDGYETGQRQRHDRYTGSRHDQEFVSQYGRDDPYHDLRARDADPRYPRGYERDEVSRAGRYAQQPHNDVPSQRGYGAGYAQQGGPWGYGEYAAERDSSGARGGSYQAQEGPGYGSQGRWNSMRGREDYSDDAGYGSGRGYHDRTPGGQRDLVRQGDWRDSRASAGYGYDDDAGYGSRGYGRGMAEGGFGGEGYRRDAHFTGPHGGPGAARPLRGDWNEPERYAASGTGGYGERRYGSDGIAAGAQRETSFRGRGPKGYRRSDERLKEDISERLSDDDDIDASEISIEVSDGKVTLSGEVEQRWMKHHVENLVDRCSGVQDIDNRLRVSRSRGNARAGNGARESGPAGGSGGGISTTGSGAGISGGAGASPLGATSGGSSESQRKKQ